MRLPLRDLCRFPLRVPSKRSFKASFKGSSRVLPVKASCKGPIGVPCKGSFKGSIRVPVQGFLKGSLRVPFMASLPGALQGSKVRATGLQHPKPEASETLNPTA